MNRGLNRSAQAACPIVREFYSSVGHTHFLTRVDYIWYIMEKTILWSTRLSFPYGALLINGQQSGDAVFPNKTTPSLRGLIRRCRVRERKQRVCFVTTGSMSGENFRTQAMSLWPSPTGNLIRCPHSKPHRTQEALSQMGGQTIECQNC